MNASNDNWSICVGRWCGIELRIHASIPVVVLCSLLLTRGSHGLDVRLVCWALVVLFSSSAVHELLRILTAFRVGGQVYSYVLAPVPGLSQVQLPADPPAHLLAALAVMGSTLTMALIAALGLTLGGDKEVLGQVMNLTNPGISYHQVILSSGELNFANTHAGLVPPAVLGELVVWVNCSLLLLSLLPVEPFAGVEIIRGLFWPVVGRGTALAVCSHLSLASSLLFAVFALLIAQSPAAKYHAIIPSWFPLAIIAVFLLFAGRRSFSTKDYDVGLAIDELDSDDEEWLVYDWGKEDREVVLVEHLQDKQQEALDRKRREREANEDAQVDAILARLHATGFDNLSDEERACLKRASRRYQRRRGLSDRNSRKDGNRT